MSFSGAAAVSTHPPQAQRYFLRLCRIKTNWRSSTSACRVFGMPGHLGELPAAARTHVVGLVEHVLALNDRALRLLAGSVACLRTHVACWPGRPALLARVAEDLAIAMTLRSHGASSGVDGNVWDD